MSIFNTNLEKMLEEKYPDNLPEVKAIIDREYTKAKDENLTDKQLKKNIKRAIKEADFREVHLKKPTTLPIIIFG